MSDCKSSISFFFVHEKCSDKPKSIRPKIVTSAMTAVFEKLTLIHLQHETKKNIILNKTSKSLTVNNSVIRYGIYTTDYKNTQQSQVYSLPGLTVLAPSK